MARDRQRAKVYRAEREWAKRHYVQRVTLTEAQALVARWSKHFDVRPPEVRYIKNLSRKGWYHWDDKKRIDIDAHYPWLSVLMHEFAHHLDIGWAAWHGGGFVELHLKVVRHAMGAREAKALQNEHVKAGACVTRTEYNLETRRLAARKRRRT